MVIKREIAENVYDIALQHLNNTVKAKLPEFQSSVVVRTPVGSTFETRRL